MSRLSKTRANLLAELEHIVGSSCYNSNIQNWGPNGQFYGEGRDFRYPLTIIDSDGSKEKIRGRAGSIKTERLVSGYYAFGANQLQIVMALDEVLKHLERNYHLKI